MSYRAIPSDRKGNWLSLESRFLLAREVADQLGIDRVEVYRLIRTGVLDGHPDAAGDMRVTPESVEQYKTSTNRSPAA